MRSLSHHIKHLQSKPHHVRHRIAVGTAGAATALIALVWLVTSASSGVFAVQGTSYAQSTGAEPALASDTGNVSGSQALAGAAAAAPQSSAAHIQIVDAAPRTATSTSQATIIPF